jgi:hypothetical protein
MVRGAATTLFLGLLLCGCKGQPPTNAADTGGGGIGPYQNHPDIQGKSSTESGKSPQAQATGRAAPPSQMAVRVVHPRPSWYARRTPEQPVKEKQQMTRAIPILPAADGVLDYLRQKFDWADFHESPSGGYEFEAREESCRWRLNVSEEFLAERSPEQARQALEDWNLAGEMRRVEGMGLSISPGGIRLESSN